MKKSNIFHLRVVIIVLAVSAITISAWGAMENPSNSQVVWLVLLWVAGVAVSLGIDYWRRQSLTR